MVRFRKGHVKPFEGEKRCGLFHFDSWSHEFMQVRITNDYADYDQLRHSRFVNCKY